jgi:phospholipid/cholesterol/gamma-HCH transport system substrate-binding protein
MRSIADKIDRGDGAVGALLNDKKIAQDLRRTIAEAKAGVAAFHEDMEALKENPLLRGFFKRRERAQRTEREGPRPSGGSGESAAPRQTR